MDATVKDDTLDKVEADFWRLRLYVAGQTPPETWVAAQEFGEHRRATLQSPRMQYGPHSARYSLILEARSPVRGTVQQYPFTFRLAPNIERTDILNETGKTTMDGKPFMANNVGSLLNRCKGRI